MARILLVDTNGTKPPLQKGVFGYDDYVAGGDTGRVYVGDGTNNIPLGKKSEIDAHKNGTGEDHTYINQDVTSTANVTFNSVTVTTTVDGRDVSADGAKLDALDIAATKAGDSVTFTGDVAGSGTVSANGNITISNMDIQSNVVLPGSPTTTTQAVGDNSTKVATTAYVDVAVAGKSTFAQLTDTSVAGVADGNVLVYDTGAWVNKVLSGDVTINKDGVTAVADNSHSHTKSNVSDFVESAYVHTTGAETIAGNKTFSNDVVITGDLTVNGSNTVLNAVNLEVKDNIVYLNSGEVGAGVTAGTSGIEIDRGTGTNYQMVFDESTDTFRAGMVGALKKVATIDDAATDGRFAMWNSSTGTLSTYIALSTNVALGESDTTVSTQKAVKAYVDSRVSTIDAASGISVVPTGNLGSTNVQGALEEIQVDVDTISGIVTGANLGRADRYLATLNIVNMVYTDGKLTKIQYVNATDVDYEVLTYDGTGRLITVEHYVAGVLGGTTTLSYVDGKLVSAIFLGV